MTTKAERGEDKMKKITIKLERENDYWLATTNISLLFGEGRTPQEAVLDLFSCLEVEGVVFCKTKTEGNTDYVLANYD